MVTGTARKLKWKQRRGRRSPPTPPTPTVPSSSRGLERLFDSGAPPVSVFAAVAAVAVSKGEGERELRSSRSSRGLQPTGACLRLCL